MQFPLFLIFASYFSFAGHKQKKGFEGRAMNMCMDKDGSCSRPRNLLKRHCIWVMSIARLKQMPKRKGGESKFGLDKEMKNS